MDAKNFKKEERDEGEDDKQMQNLIMMM